MIRVGVVGFGLAGRVFHSPLVSSVAGLELAGIVERSGNLAAERYPQVKTYRSFEELANDAQIDLLVIATPSGTHVELARQALQAGKHVVVDKPVSPAAAEVEELGELAESTGRLLIPFHNRRWDGDFLTVSHLVRENAVGRLVAAESRMDRWNPGATRRPWKEDPEQGGGVLLDLGTHLVDQALALFGLPEAVVADVLRERDGEGANDSFTIRLRYAAGLRVTLGANALSSAAGTRFVLRGTGGNFRKFGVDPQERDLGKLTRISGEAWGKDAAADWGTLTVDVSGAIVSRPVETLAGDYRKFYEGVRDAVEGGAATPVTVEEAWRVARVLEWAEESSRLRCEVHCEWDRELK